MSDVGFLQIFQLTLFYIVEYNVSVFNKMFVEAYMKSTRLLLSLIVILAIIIGVTGCGNKEAEPAPDNTGGISETETPYMLYDENEIDYVYLSEDHPEVVKVAEFVEEFITAMNTMDYKTISNDKAYPYLTQSLLEVTKEQKTWESLFNTLKEIEVVSEAMGIEIENALFDHKFEIAYILYNSTINILEANEEKLAESNMTLGENLENAVLILLKEDGQWKVQGIETLG